MSSIGEVDDYYQTDPALMTSGNTVSRSIVQFPGQEYQDAVGIRVGHSTGTAIAHNDVGYTPYSGISVGWGWGWTSHCTHAGRAGTARRAGAAPPTPAGTRSSATTCTA